MEHTFGTPQSKRRATIELTDGNDANYISEVMRLYDRDVNADEHNREPAREDIRFVIGDQWSEQDRASRTRNNKPVLTVNRLPAFVAQYIGSWMQSDTTIKLSPSHSGNKLVAEIRQGIIRAIMRGVKGKHALDQAMMHSYISGVGNFSIDICENENDVFANDIRLRAHEDPFEVIWDRASREPTGADAKHCFVFDSMTKDDFDEAYPDSEGQTGWPMDESLQSSLTGYGWDSDDMVRVCNFWQMRKEAVVLALEEETNDVIDITDMPEEEWRVKVAVDPDTQQPIIRDTFKPYAECYVLSRDAVLEGPYRLDIPRVPVFRVPGWVMWENNVQHRWGFVRNAKDPQRLHNYWRSILAEELAKSVSSKWLLDAAAMQSGLADRFRNAHLSNDNVLFWDSQSDGAKPERIDPPATNQAVLTEAAMTVQDIKDVTNKHEASFGIQSNEVSGKAISARQRVSELGDVIYIEHMNMALAEAGRVMNELIPVVYDTRRTVKIMGEDDEEQIQAINDDLGDKTPDITKGRYDLTYSTGPSYATKRQEAVDVITTLMNTMPQVGNITADILVRNMDIPGAEEIEDRLAAALPEGMIDLDRLTPKRRAKVEKRMEIQQKQQAEAQQKQDAMLMAQLQKTKAEISEIMARAEKQGMQALVEESRVGIEQIEAFIKLMAVKVDEAKVGVQVDGLRQEAVIKGLEAAQTNAQRQEDRQAALEDRAAAEPKETGSNSTSQENDDA